MEGFIRNLVIDSVFPRFCASCHKEGSLWCAVCSQTWSFKPQALACGFCRKEGSNRTCRSCTSSVSLDGLIAFGPYANPVIRSMLHSWKFVGDRSAEPILKRWIFMQADRLQPPMLPFYLTPIPLHEKRLRVRGFDQAHVLATWVEQMFGLPVLPLLERRVYTSPQAQVTDHLRQVGEMDTVFQVRGEFLREGMPKHVLLCDDVFTSGATMDAAAQVLKEQGAETVWGFVIAKGI